MKKLLIVLMTVLLLTACGNTNNKVDAETDADVDKEVDQVENRDIYEQFVDKLTQQTKDKELDWDTVLKVTQQYEADSFDFILFTNEFHMIDELESYGIVNEYGLSIFLLNEQFESGKDGSVSDELNLYVVKGIGDGFINEENEMGEQSFKIPVDQEELLDLETAINDIFEEFKNKSLDDLIEEYIEAN